jgi:16S rRNA (cytosine1402-N4)-methyltransferase
MEEEHSGGGRRPRYPGRYPRKFSEKYKELDPGRYAGEIERVKGRGQTPAGTHIPICVDEILGILAPEPGERGLDATLGYGGHSGRLLSAIQPGGILVSLDVDPMELPKAEARLRSLGYPEGSSVCKRMNFSQAALLPAECGFKFDFALADLGVSSMQIDNPERGFSFRESGALDLRLDPQSGRSAAELLATMDEAGLAALLRDSSDETRSFTIAKSVLAYPGGVKTTDDLVAAIEAALSRVPMAERKEETIKACKRCFQALRIAVNKEFQALEGLLSALPGIMNPGGRIAILSFHSGEDRRVKKAFQAGLRGGVYSQVAADPIRPGPEEKRANPRSASAKLRWAILSG